METSSLIDIAPPRGGQSIAAAGTAYISDPSSRNLVDGGVERPPGDPEEGMAPTVGLPAGSEETSLPGLE